MTDSNPQTAAAKKPTYIASVVRDGNDGKKRWLEVGAAWPHKDGEGFNVEVDCFIFTFTLVLRKPSAKPSKS